MTNCMGMMRELLRDIRSIDFDVKKIGYTKEGVEARIRDRQDNAKYIITIKEDKE